MKTDQTTTPQRLRTEMNVNATNHILSVSIPSSPTSPSGGAVGSLYSRRRGGSGTATSRGSGSGNDGADDSQPPFPLVRMPPVASRGVILQDILTIAGLIGVQVINSVYIVFLSPLLALGLNPLFIITFGTLATSIFILPFAIVYEKKKWPSRLSLKLVIQFVVIALGGVSTFQALMLVGIKKTSPAIASAMPNLAPGIIFVIAACLGYEKLDMKCMYSRTKILGTIVCLGGAITMSILQSPAGRPTGGIPQSSPPPPSQGGDYGDWLVGCLFLLAAVLVVSCVTVLQAATMIDFPAPFTLCSVTASMGSVFTALGQIIMEGKVSVGNPVIGFSTVASIVLLGGIVSALCIGFQTWAVKKKGPVLVSMFSPTQTVCSAILSAIVLRQIIKIWSILGMFLMFSGLYMVLWAKKKEGVILPSGEDTTQPSTDDVEKPLLS